MKRTLIALFALSLTAALSFADAPTTQPTMTSFPLTPDGKGGYSDADATTRPTASAYPLKTDVVTGEPLGDKAIVEQVDGREVHFANADNADKFKAGGEAMQKKMDDAIIAATKDSYPLKKCVVSDEDLGDMGDAVLYVYRPTNQLVEFCCSSCPKKFKADPTKYLPKLAAK